MKHSLMDDESPNVFNTIGAISHDINSLETVVSIVTKRLCGKCGYFNVGAI